MLWFIFIYFNSPVQNSTVEADKAVDSADKTEVSTPSLVASQDSNASSTSPANVPSTATTAAVDSG